MADNINVDPGTGGSAVPVATDDVGGVQYQVIKIATGADGAATYLSNANPLPISDAGGTITVDGTVAVTGSVTASGTVAATQSGTWNIGTVTTLPAITGTVTANVGTGTQPVSGTVAATQSGTWNIAAITTLPAIPAGTNNIGDVDVLTLPALPAGTNNIGDVDVLTLPVAYNTGSASATTQRVVIASDQLGALGQTTMSASVPVTIASNQSALSTADAGDIAHDAADSGNPVKVGYKATAALSGATLVAAADRVNAVAGLDGVQIVRTHCNLEDIVTSGIVSNTDGTSTQVLAAGAAGIKNYLTSVSLINTSATNIYVEIKDGSTTKIALPVPATSGCVFNPPVPIPGTAATAWNFDGSAAATTLYCSVIGFKSKV